ncbi:MAG: hypothetical protein H0V89_13305 [Deltaproteobacteria bacterium]|nr:hypothetical protein [Deltaproteobacteria bacterium]
MTSRSLVVVLALAACAKKQDPDAPTENLVTEVSSDGTVEQRVDFDANGQAEVINFYRERTEGSRVLIRKELDLNRDGKSDVITYLDDRGSIEKEQMDGDFDGKFELVDTYQGGQRMTTEYDTDGDGKANVFKYYLKDQAGKIYLDRKERDENGDGRVDVWEKFDASGSVIITGRDSDGDGKMDERQE